jgi:hypothetical protein
MKPNVVVDLYGDRILEMRICSSQTQDSLAKEIVHDTSCLSKVVSNMYPGNILLAEECFRVTGNNICSLSQSHLKEYVARGTIVMLKLVPHVEVELVYNPTLLHRLLQSYNVPTASQDPRFTEILQYNLANPDY